SSLRHFNLINLIIKPDIMKNLFSYRIPHFITQPFICFIPFMFLMLLAQNINAQCTITPAMGSPTNESGTISSGSWSSGYFAITGNITVTGTLTISSSSVIVGTNKHIEVQGGATLTISGSQLYGNSHMWQGIIVDDGATISFTDSKISDALVAI